MEIRTLRYFLAVAREENMTRASKYLHVTQPTLSRQLKALEEELGKKLFVRSNYSINLTEEGLLLRTRVEDILNMVDKTIEEFSSLDDLNGGDIYIGCPESDSIKFFAQAAKRLQEHYPRIKYHLFSGNTEAVTERLDKGLLDFAIIVQQADLTKYNYLTVPTKDMWGVIMRKDHPLALKEYIQLDDLMDIALIGSRQGIEEDYPKWFGEKMNHLNIVATYNLIYNASIFVKEGLGVALGFDKLVDTSNESILCFRPLIPNLKTKMNIIWKKYQTFSPAAELFLKEMKKQF